MARRVPQLKHSVTDELHVRMAIIDSIIRNYTSEDNVLDEGLVLAWEECKEAIHAATAK